MDRRGFVGAAAAGLGSFFLSQKTEASDQWWEEKNFVFEGIPGTEFLWPTDRLIHLEEPDKDKYGRSTTILIPTFSLLGVDYDLDQQMRDAVKWQKSSDEDRYIGSYIHLIRVKENSDQVGIMMFSKKCNVVVDCWKNEHINERILLKNKQERRRKGY